MTKSPHKKQGHDMPNPTNMMMHDTWNKYDDDEGNGEEDLDKQESPVRMRKVYVEKNKDVKVT